MRQSTTAPTRRMFFLVPVPVSTTLCGEPEALSVNTKALVFVPTEVGPNVTEAVQVAPGASDPVQVFAERTNCDESPPVMATLVNVTEEGKLLVNETLREFVVLCGFWLPNDRMSGVIVTGAV